MPTFKIQAGGTAYRVVGPNNEEGEAADYGAPAFLVIGSRVFMAFLDPPVNAEGDVADEDWDPSRQAEPVPAKVFRLREAEATTVEEVSFDFEEGEEEEEDGDEDEEEEEGVQV